jgi:hypothetical protein
MIEDSSEKNRMLLAATLNTGFESAGVENNAENRRYFAELIDELDAAPEGVMLSPVNEWPDDKYDELSANTWKAWGAPRTLQQMKDDEK